MLQSEHDPGNPKPSDSSSINVPSLDSLLSPTAPKSTAPVRDSGSEFNEVTLDDETRFSTVPLSGMEMEIPLGSSPPLANVSRDRTISVDTSLEEGPQEIVYRKETASAVSSPSSARLPFMISRLEGQNGEPSSQTNRNSQDGQHKIQEEFARLHKEQQEDNDNSGIDWDFWGEVISDYQGYAADHGEKLAQAIEKGIPNTLRGMVWQLMTASKDAELEAVYLKLLKETSPHEKAILRDLGRTFPHHEFFTDGHGIGQENLFNVLKAYSLYDDQVGYCQGLPFVAAVLLLNMPDEEAFSLLVRLMYSYDLRGHFLPDMPKLQLRLFQYERLVEELLPVLHVHFLRQGIKASMFCSQWFLTLFSYRFPLDIVFRIYDNCLASGIEAIFAFGIVLLHKNEEALLARKFDEILGFLTNQLLDAYKVEGTEGTAVRYNVNHFVEDAFGMKITPFLLDTYAQEYQQMIRAREAHVRELNELRNNNRILSAQVKMLESSLAQLNAEHVEVLNQIVMERLRNEEMEGELVRYKLLYAEAVHENEDAHASRRLSTNTMISTSSGGHVKSPRNWGL